MSESSISLKITLPNKISFYVEMENCDYISDLKEKCSQITSIPSESMNLIYENRILLNENQIKYYMFEKDKEIYLQSNSKNLITEKAITEITSGRSDWELTIRVQYMLVQSGDLFAEIRCVQTGKVINVKFSNAEFVDYEE